MTGPRPTAYNKKLFQGVVVAVELLIFANFRFETVMVPMKVIVHGQVKEADRFALNWPEYTDLLRKEGLDVDSPSRWFFSRYEPPRPDRDFFDDLIKVQTEVREILNVISRDRLIPVEVWKTTFREAERLTEIFVPVPQVESAVHEEDLKAMVFEKSVMAETYRAFLLGELKDLIVSKQVFRIRKCPECGIFFMDQTKNQRKVYCSPASCGNRAKQRAFNARRRSQVKPADDFPQQHLEFDGQTPT